MVIAGRMLLQRFAPGLRVRDRKAWCTPEPEVLTDMEDDLTVFFEDRLRMQLPRGAPDAQPRGASVLAACSIGSGSRATRSSSCSIIGSGR